MYTAENIQTDFMDAEVILGGGSRKVSSYNFSGGRISAILGGMEIDLTNCALAKEAAVIELNIVAGGITLIVPKEWNIQNEVTPIMGGINDEGADRVLDYIDPAALLMLKGKIIMGGMEIKRI